MFVPSGAPSRVRHNDPVDDGDDLYSDRDMDADERRDYEDQDPHIPPTSTADLGRYASFLQNLPDYNDVTQEEFNTALEALQLPLLEPPPPDIPFYAAIEARPGKLYTPIS